MKRNLLFTALLAFGVMHTATAQIPLFPSKGKMDGKLVQTLNESRLYSRSSEGRLTVKALREDTPLDILINASDAPALASDLEAAGIEVRLINDHVLTADIPLSKVKEVAGRSDVYHMQLPRRFRPLLDNTRKDIRADEVHAGTELETPFDGTGVLVAVIDQGFEPKHIAFNDPASGTSRVLQYWNRKNYERQKNTKPSAAVPNGGDGIPADGHATHVTSIAAGSDVGNGLKGIAPKASLYMIPSSFDENELIQDMQTIASYAKTQGMPYVINLSLGSQMGPHDGTTLYDLTLDALLRQGGGFICAAMGNEGNQRIHTSHTFTADDEKQSILVQAANAQSYYAGMIWEDATDGQRHVTFRPFYLLNGEKNYLTDDQRRTLGAFQDEVSPYNGKHFYAYEVAYADLKKLTNSTAARFGVEMTGTEGASIHAWVEADQGEFLSRTGYLPGDTDYLNSEGGASIPHAFGIASYAVVNTFKSANGSTYGGFSTGVTKGDICSFSSPGPWFGTEPRPTIATPGFMVKAAVSSYDQYFDADDTSITNIETKDSKKYYYAQRSGTSMATPVATGSVALWLQANPDLTYEQMMQIFEQTARRDNYTGEEWNKYFGYGKIDTYAGLRMALEMANTGIRHARLNTDTPVTLLKGTDAWRILFNNDETYAHITLCTVSGQRVSEQRLNNVRRGAEEILPLTGLTPGAYVLSIQTTGTTMSRKLLIP